MKKKEETPYNENRLFEYACRYITRYPSSRLRMKEKLSGKNPDGDMVEKVIKRLESFGYVNDRAAADSVVRNLCRRGYGKSRILLKLREKKITDRKLIDEVMEENNSEAAEEENIKKLVSEKKKKYRIKTAPGRKKFIDYLSRRGFGIELILNEFRKQGII